MTRIRSIMRRATVLTIGGSLAVLLSVSSPAENRELQVGRYQSVLLQPSDEQMHLLSGIVEIEFPEEINTIGQAVTHLLQGSGYQLQSANFAESERHHLFGMPLPDVQRQLGPLSLSQALQLLAGTAHRLVIEPTYRLVSFELIKTTSDAHACSD